jgi:hypothetical protein
MKKKIVFAICLLFSASFINSQTVQAPAKDTSKYRANDRLRTAGPKDGWKTDSTELKIDSLKINNKGRLPGKQKNAKDKKIKT